MSVGKNSGARANRSALRSAVLRATLLAASVAPLALIAAAGPALAQSIGNNGSNGGSASNYFTPGAGGNANTSGDGVVTGTAGSGGGTGGSGPRGGGGGGSDGGGGGGGGGPFGGGGGGGGAGGAGTTLSATGTNTITTLAVGGRGGNGGTGNYFSSNPSSFGGGGGGGGGGSGIVVTGTNAGVGITVQAGVTVEGGQGGNGGFLSGNAGGTGDNGRGGGGGDGITSFSNPNGLTIINNGTIKGGQGGRGANNNADGPGGAGIAGVGLTIVNNAGATIAGNNSIDGGSNSPAIYIAGGVSSIQNSGSIGLIEIVSGATTISGVYSDKLVVGAATLNVTTGDATGFSSIVNNYGTINIGVGRTLSATGDIGNVGAINVGAGATMAAGGRLQNVAVLKLAAGSVVSSVGDIYNDIYSRIEFNSGAGGTATLSSGTGSIVNLKEIEAVSGTAIIVGNIDNRTSTEVSAIDGQVTHGSISLTGGDMTVAGNVTNSGNATVNVAAGRKLGLGTFTMNSGTVTGTGTIEASTAFNPNSAGTISTALTGAGTLTKGGAGTTILTGANSYTGGTTISAGTLQIGNGAASGSIVGNVVNNGTLALNRSDDITLAGNISGSGSLIKAGAGTTTLTGANIYTGGTTVSSGILRLGFGADTGTLRGAVTVGAAGAFNVVRANTSGITTISNAGQVQFDNSTSAGSATITNTGLGGIGFTGASTAGTAFITNDGGLHFQGASTAGNATIINNNTLMFWNNATAGSAAITNNSVGTVNFSQSTGPAGDGKHTAGSISGGGYYILGANGLTVGSNDLSTAVSGVISGGGSLTKVGSGTMTLGGANTYTGGTTISGSGKLQIGDGGSIVGNVVNNATLQFNRADTYTFGGNISGTGIVQQTGAGTLVLTGANSHTGMTTIHQGTLQLGNAGTMASIGGIISLATAGTFEVVNADTSALTRIANAGTTNFRNGTSAGGAEISNQLTLAFHDTSTAGSGTISNFATLNFNDNSAAGSALFDNRHTLNFYGTSTADGSTITNTNTGSLSFNNDSSAGSAVITNNGSLYFSTISSAENARITNSDTLEFRNTTTAGAATITNVGSLSFKNDSKAGTATITNNADLQFLDTSTADSAAITTKAGSLLTFRGTSTAGSATITTEAGAASRFFDNSSGGNGRFITDADGMFDLSSLTVAGVTAGSIEGAGEHHLGSKELTVGGNNRSTTVSGLIADGGLNGGTGGSLVKAGTGTLTLTGANTYSGGTTVGAGTLEFGGTAGSILGDVFNNGTLAFNRTNTHQFDGAISGAGSVVQRGGTTILTGVNTYTGATTVSGGKLLVNGSIASSSGVTVDLGATIGGNGTLSDTLVNGTLSAGNSPGMLTVDGNLTLGAGSTSVFDLAAAGVVGDPSNDLVYVTGDLTLDGTLQAPGAVSGYYRLFNVDGTISGNFASVPMNSDVQTAVPNQVNLFVRNSGQLVQFWDGGDNTGNGAVDGGAGTWSAAGTNWTGDPTSATFNDQWRGEVGVFAGTAGTVTVSGPVAFQGIQLSTDGYTLAGNDLTMTGDSAGNAAASFVTVDGGVNAEISSALTGAAGIGLDKFGNGKLTLSAVNAYTGTTTIKSGTLALAGNGSIAKSDVVAVDGGMFDISATTLPFSSINSLAGTSAGTVQLGTNGLAITNGSTEFAGSIEGDGGLEIVGGTQTLSGVSTYINATQIDAGATLALKGNGSIASSAYVGFMFGGTLDISQTATGASVGGLYNPTGAGIVALGSRTLTITGGAVFNGSIQDGGIAGGTGGSLVIANGAVQALARSNSFTGATTIDAGGELLLIEDGNLSASSGIAANGVFDITEHTAGQGPAIKSLTGSGTVYLGARDLRITDAAGTFAGVISDCGASGTDRYSVSSGGGLVLEGGALTLSGANTYTGGTVVGRFASPPTATLTIANNNALGTGSVLLNAGGVLQAGVNGLDLGNSFAVSSSYGTINTNGFTMTVSGVIADGGDPGTLHKAGAGTLILTNANTYGDGTVVKEGTLQLGDGGATGSILGDVAVGGVLAFNRSDSNTFAGTISDDGANAGQVVQQGTGTLVLTGANSYSGGTIVEHGTLSLASSKAAGTGAITTQDGSVVDYADGVTIANDIIVGTGIAQLQVLTGTATQAGDISGASGPRPLEKTGAGTLVLSGTNSHGGGTTVSAGTLKSGLAGAFTDNTAYTVNGGALDLNGFDLTMSTLAGSGGTVALGAADLKVDQTGNTSFSGFISGSGSFTKAGSGDLQLSGINTYTGATMVSGGKLLVNGSIAASSGLTVNAGATIGGSGILPSTIVNGTLSAGNSPGTLTVNGDLTLGAGSTSLFELQAAGVVGDASNDLVAVTGNLALGGTLQTPGAVSGYYRLFNFGGAISGAFATTPAGANVVTAVPGQVNLLMRSGGQIVQFWDGADVVGNGTVDGGTGTWSAATTSWTGAPGSANFNDRWRGQVGVFAGTAGTVTVSGPIAFQGLQFATSGYAITGGDLTLSGNPHGNSAASFVNVDGGVTATIASALTGAGIGLDKLGAGTLILTGNNSYTGVTTVSAGTLRAGAAKALVGNTAYTVNGGMLDMNGFDLTMSSLAGTGGTVALGGGDLTVDQAGETGFSGAFTGAGSLTKDGAGKLLLSGTSTYTGQTFVKRGTLSVDGDISSSSLLTVGPGGILGGTGILPSVQLNGGTLAPGNSIGTVTVAGDLTFGAGSVYAVETSTTAADRTNVSGRADLSGGTVVVSYAPGTYVVKSYTILNAAGGLGGTEFKAFNAATLPGLQTSLSYDGNNVYLKTKVNQTDPGCTTDCEPGFGNLSRNQKAVANAILGYFDRTGTLPAEFATLDAGELSQASGEIAAAAISAGIDSSDQFMGELDGQRRAGSVGGSASGVAAYAEESKATGGDTFAPLGMSGSNGDKIEAVFASRWQAWGSAYGGAEKIGGDPLVGSHDTDVDTFGLIGGVSRQWDNTKLGLALGGGSSNFSLSDDLGSGQTNNFNAGIFAQQGFGDAYVAGVFAYGFHDTETNRIVQGDSLNAEFNAQSFSGRVESGYRFDTSIAALTPYAAFQAIAYRLPAYSETGSGVFALGYDADTTVATRTELGLNLDRTIMLENGSRLMLSGRAAWAINGGTERRVTSTFQSLPGATFTIDGAKPDRNSLLVDAAAEYKTRSGFFASLGFVGEFSGNVQSYSGKAKLGVNW